MLLDLPPNASITFYDDRTLYSPTGAQQRKLPPFKTVTKEIHNALNAAVYIHTDNRGQPVISRGNEIDDLVDGIVSLSILNKFVIQYDLNRVTSTPAAINRPTPTGKILPVDKLKKIKAATSY